MTESGQHLGASADAETGSREPSPSCTGLGPPGFDPARNEPEWLQLARDTIAAVAFQRGTRGVHVVGKDGRVRLGCVDLLGMYAVDEMARKWADYLGVDFPDAAAVPTERQAMWMMAKRESWRDFDPSAPELTDAEVMAHLASWTSGSAQDRNGLDPKGAGPTAEGGGAQDAND